MSTPTPEHAEVMNPRCLYYGIPLALVMWLIIGGIVWALAVIA